MSVQVDFSEEVDLDTLDHSAFIVNGAPATAHSGSGPGTSTNLSYAVQPEDGMPWSTDASLCVAAVGGAPLIEPYAGTLPYPTP